MRETTESKVREDQMRAGQGEMSPDTSHTCGAAGCRIKAEEGSESSGQGGDHQRNSGVS